MPFFELRGVVEWSDEEGDHREITVRDTKHSSYQSFEVSPNADPVDEAAKHLNVEKDEITLPEHVKKGVK